MTADPMTVIAANACMDCPAQVALLPSQGINGEPIMVVTVAHVTSCPWAARYVGESTAIITRPEGGSVVHFRQAST